MPCRCTHSCPRNSRNLCFNPRLKVSVWLSWQPMSPKPPLLFPTFDMLLTLERYEPVHIGTLSSFPSFDEYRFGFQVKSKIYDTGTGSSHFRIVWISQASSEQRAGRAGRIGPGHCYRLYSSRIYANEMEPFSPPDILTRPIDEVVLLLKVSSLPSFELFRV